MAVVSLLGDSHVRAVFCPPHVLYTSLGHEPPRLCTAPEGIKGVPSYQWEEQDPKMGCHLDRNSDPPSSPLSLTPPILLTADSGLCHFIFYMWTFSLTAPGSDHSESKQVSWWKPEPRGVTWLNFLSSRNAVPCLVCSWLDSRRESRGWSPCPSLVWGALVSSSLGPLEPVI